MTVSLQQVGLAVKRLQSHHHRSANVALATIDLSLPQWDVLRHMADEPDASLHDLAVLTFQSDQAMGTMATRMVDRGLIIRVIGSGRSVRHRLTAAGERARVAGSEILDGVLAESLGSLTAAELADLGRLLLKATPR